MNGEYIFNETLSGVINGINKTFTTVNNIDKIEEVYLGGAPYRNIIFTGNVITFGDAPPIGVDSPTIDYFKVNVTPIVVGSNNTYTFGNIKSKVWGLLGQKSSSVNFSNTIIGEQINIILRKILKGRVKNILNGQILRAGELYFLNKKYFFRVYGGTTLAEDLLVGDLTAGVNTEYLQSSGYVQIDTEIIQYTGITNDTITGITGQSITHNTGANVMQLYEMPTDMDKPHKVWIIKNGKEYEIPYKDGRYKYYDVIRIGKKTLLKLIGFNNNDIIRVEYVLDYTDMSDDTELNPLPDNYGISVCAYLVTGGLAYEKMLPIAERVLNMGYDNLQSMYQEYTNTTNIIEQGIKPQSYKFNSLRR